MGRLKKFFAILFAFVAAFASSNANAEGYFGAPTKYKYEGWACNPATPYYAGWIHFWRDDGKFLGALNANIQREPAVGSICGDNGVHGFSGILDIPYEYLDNKSHTVRAYFINQDGATSIELQNSVQVLFDGGAQPYVFNEQTSDACQLPSPFWAAPGWLAVRMSGSFPYCPAISGWSSAPTFAYFGDPNIPVGTTKDVCTHPANVQKIPAGWQTIAVKQDHKCIAQIHTVQVGGSNPSHTVTYVDTWTIKKMY